MVLMSSRLGLVCVTQDRSTRKGFHRPKSRFLRTYARKLPSSLTRDHSSTLACSASLPVSVCGTGTPALRRQPFSPVQVPRPCARECSRPSHSPLGQRHRRYPAPPYQLGRRSSRRGASPPGSDVITGLVWYRNIDLLSISGPPCGGPLGPTNPPRITRAAEPSGFRWWGFAPHFSVTRSGIRTRRHSTRTSVRASTHRRRSPTASYVDTTPSASARDFAPLDCRRSGTRPVSCYALFQGWLLLSQPPGCLGTATAFATQPRFGGLSWRSGLFPFRRRMFALAVSLHPAGVCIRSLPRLGRQ
jgi:hypothetical protein